MNNIEDIIETTKRVSKRLNKLKFHDEIAYVYNPLEYTADVHFEYWRRFGVGKKKHVFLGMNPGPFGMAQTGIPFGEISFVKDWMGLDGKIDKPKKEHPKRPIEGFDCQKSEVSGRRLWGYFSQLHPKAKDFFKHSFVINYCPLVFMGESGKNITPDKIPAEFKEPLEKLCDAYLAAALKALNPDWAIGVGGFAHKKFQKLQEDFGLDYKITKIIHPSPASPVANRGWAEQVEKSLKVDGIVV